VELEVKYSGFCHTDLHIANNDLGITSYPVVPGHEVAGVVTKVGSKVQDLKIGDHVGIGYFIDSCLSCEYCVMDDETNCLKGKTMTAAGAIRFGRIKTDNGKYSYGGFSKKMIANRHFISKIPKSYPLEKAGPCFCAGVTMFGPLKEYGARPGGKNVGIAGFGGLGQMGNHINLSPEQHLQCQGCARIQDDQDFQECLKWQKAKLGFLISIGSRVALGQGHGKQRDDRVIITQQRSYGQVYGSW